MRTCIMNVRHSFRITPGKFNYNLFRLCKRSPGKLYGFPLSVAHKNMHNSNWTPRNAHAHMRTAQRPHVILLVKLKVVGAHAVMDFPKTGVESPERVERK